MLVDADALDGRALVVVVALVVALVKEPVPPLALAGAALAVPVLVSRGRSAGFGRRRTGWGASIATLEPLVLGTVVDPERLTSSECRRVQ